MDSQGAWHEVSTPEVGKDKKKKRKRKGRRKEKDIDTTNKPYLADDLVHKRIADVDMEHLIDQPQGLDYNEWLATHTISFFEHLNLMYGAVSEYCTSTGCVAMSGPNNMQYLWLDPKGKKCKCAAPQYVEYVMSTSQETLNDESVFPTKYGNTFPDTFESSVKKIHTWLFHVLAHIYHAHYKEILQLCLHSHLNTLFLHFAIFNKRYHLVDDKETEILEDLYQKLQHPVITPTKDSGGSSQEGVEQGGSPTKGDAKDGSPVNSVTMQECLAGDGMTGEGKEDNAQTVVMAEDNKENSTPVMAQQQAQANGQPRNPSS